MAKPSLLVVTPRYPFPVIGGDRLRIYHLCRILSEYFDITLVSIHDEKTPSIGPTPTERKVFKTIHLHYLPKWKSLLKTASGLLNRYPMQVNYYWDSSFARKLESIAQDYNYCLLHMARTARYGQYCAPDAYKVLEMMDAVSRNYRGMKNSKGFFSLRRLIFQLEHRKLVDYEQEALALFSLTTLVSNVDRRYLLDEHASRDTHQAQNTPPEIAIVPNGIEIDRYTYLETWTINQTIAFVGNVTSLQNFDACFYFASEVLPYLREKYGIKFRIVGRISDRERSALEKFPGVVITGEVKSIPDAMSGASVGVCPVRVSAGIQNKVLEYMALGLPAIVTFNSTIALNLKHNQEVLVADAPSEFIAQFERLHSDSSLCDTLRTNGRSFVETNHQWHDTVSDLARKILMAGKQASTPDKTHTT